MIESHTLFKCVSGRAYVRNVFRWPSSQCSKLGKLFCGCEPDLHVLETAQYADKLLEETRHVPNPVMVPVYRNRFKEGLRTALILATSAKQRSRSPRNTRCVLLSSREKSLAKQESYGSNYGVQKAASCWMWLARNHRMKTCLYTVRSGELAQKR